MAKTRSIPDKFEALVSNLKERYASTGKKAYYISDLQKQNPDLDTKRIKEWAKQVTGMNATDYFTSIGLLAPPEYYPDDSFSEISLEELKDKTFFVMSESTYTRDDIVAMLQDYDGTESKEYHAGVDYVFVPKTTLRKAPPEQMPGLAALLQRIEADGDLKGKFLYTHALTEQHKAIVERRRMNNEQRQALGVIFSETYISPPAADIPACCPKFKINNNVKDCDIPVYHPETIYWSLQMFYDWFDTSGGVVRPGTTLKDLSRVKESVMESHKIRRNFEQFAILCKSLDMPEIQAYICQNAAIEKNEALMLNHTFQIASLGLIEDFDGCYTLVAESTSQDTITVSLQKTAMMKHYDDMDYSLNKGGIDRIPPELLRILIPLSPSVCPRRNQSGYIFVDCADGNIPEAVFANDPTIRYVEFSERILHTGLRAFENCANLEEIYFGPNVEVISALCFSNCKKIQKISFPDSVRELHNGCFEGCEGLEEIQFSQWSSCSNLGHKTFRNCKNLTRVVIPDLVEFIDSYTFENCEKLENVSLSRWFYKIGAKAFAGCRSLTSVSNNRCLCDTIHLESNSFEGCPNLMLIPKERWEV